MLSSNDSRFNDAKEAILRVLAGQSTPDDEEHERLDFKEEANRRDGTGNVLPGEDRNQEAANGLAKSVACFANHIGGTIVVGVDDSATGRDAFLGTELDASWLTGELGSLTTPRVDVAIAEHTVDAGKVVRLLLIDVPKKHVLIEAGGKYHQRSGAKCRELTKEERLLYEASLMDIDWSKEPSAARISDASPEAVERVRELLRSSGDERKIQLSKLSPEALWRDLRLTSSDRFFNKAGQLLLVGRAELFDCAARSSPGAAASAKELLDGPLVLAIRDAQDFVLANLATFSTHVDLAVTQRAAIPPRVCREALVNAAVHRNYRVDTPVTVEVIRNEALKVTSPGSLPWGVTPENIIYTPPVPLNKTLRSALQALTLAEGEGVGVDTMYRDMVFQGSPPPDISDSDSNVVCYLSGGRSDESLLKLRNRLSKEVQDDTDLAVIVHALLSQPSLTPEECSKYLGKSQSEALDALQIAEDERVIRQTSRSTSKNLQYRLEEDAYGLLLNNITYKAPGPGTTSEEDIIAYLRQNQAIRTKDASQLLDMTAPSASRVLRRMRRKRIVNYGSDQERGRGVFYIPGPDFPAE